MNIRDIKIYLKNNGGASSTGFIFCAVLFFVGALIGAMSANFIAVDDGQLLKNLFLDLSGGLYSGGDFFTALLHVFFYHAIAVFLGFAAFGFVLLPLLSGIRGFMLSFVAAAVIRALGKGGFFVALIRFGLPAIITVPCFFVLSVQAFAASYVLTARLMHRHPSHIIYEKKYFGRMAVCAAALLIATVIEAYISPQLTALAALH